MTRSCLSLSPPGTGNPHRGFHAAPRAALTDPRPPSRSVPGASAPRMPSLALRPTRDPVAVCPPSPFDRLATLSRSGRRRPCPSQSPPSFSPNSTGDGSRSTSTRPRTRRPRLALVPRSDRRLKQMRAPVALEPHEPLAQRERLAGALRAGLRDAVLPEHDRLALLHHKPVLSGPANHVRQGLGPDPRSRRLLRHQPRERFLREALRCASCSRSAAVCNWSCMGFTADATACCTS